MPLLRRRALHQSQPEGIRPHPAGMGSLRMDIRRLTRESAIGRAVKRTRPSSADEVIAAKWYGMRPVPAMLRPVHPRHPGATGVAGTR
jgi:hypothetical protein